MLKISIFVCSFFLIIGSARAQADAVKISCNTNIKELHPQILGETTRKEVITIQLIDKGGALTIESVANYLKFSFGGGYFIDKEGKSQKTKQYNSSDEGKWDVMELRTGIKSGDWFSQSIQIDRHSGIFNYSQLTSNRILESEGKCSKIDTRSRKF